jgi:hypothetical protein
MFAQSVCAPSERRFGQLPPRDARASCGPSLFADVEDEQLRARLAGFDLACTRPGIKCLASGKSSGSTLQDGRRQCSRGEPCACWMFPQLSTRTGPNRGKFRRSGPIQGPGERQRNRSSPPIAARGTSESRRSRRTRPTAAAFSSR